jgi:hypothetical protein
VEAGIATNCVTRQKRSTVSVSSKLKGRSIGDAATSRVLYIPPLIYREYAAELRELALTATNGSRALYLKMTNTWTYAAVRFEAGGVEHERETWFGIS